MEQTAYKSTRPQTVAGVAGQATVLCQALDVWTNDAPEFIDITDEVTAAIQAAGLRFGQVTVFSTHTTAAIKINENEPLLLQDMCRLLQHVAPQDGYYDHNDFTRRTVNMNEDECANGHAHCQHLFLGTSETVPVVDGALTLGQWQRIFLVELDHPRQRRVLINIVGTTEGQ